MFLKRRFYRRFVLVGLLLGFGVLSYCIYLSIKNINLQEKVTAHSIGVLDGVLLKKRAKCFAVHDETSKMLSDVFTQVRNSEKKAKEEYEKIRSSKGISLKKKQQELIRIESKWKQISESYDKKALDIKLLDNKLSEKINKTLNNVLREISTRLNLILILNKGSEGMLNVFYNVSSLDVTDKVVTLMDKKLEGFNINSVSIETDKY